MTMTAYDQGLAWGSCEMALDARKALGPEASQADWWKVCDRGDWLVWQLQWLSTSEYDLIHPALDRAVEKIITRAIRRGQKTIRGMKAPWATKWRRWARRWLNGEDRSPAVAEMVRLAAETATEGMWEARTVVWATDAAAPNVASKALWAATRAADAEMSVSWVRRTAASRAAVANELRLQTRNIHKELPEWPGSK